MTLPKISVPTYTLKLPSTGDMIDYRPYLVKEEKLLMMALESQDQVQMVKAMGDIIHECTFQKIDPNKHTMFDVEYVFTQLRSKSVGETAEISVKCSHCEKENKTTVNYNEIKVPVKSEEEMTIILTNDISVKMRYPKVANIMDVLAVEGRSQIEMVFLTIAAHIDCIFMGSETFHSDDYKPEELVDFLENLNTEQFAKVRDHVAGAPVVSLDVNFKCKDCGKDNDVVLAGTNNFF